MILPHRGVLLVVSGPSGVGKGAVISEVLQRRPHLRKSVSCTTRPMREGELEGRDYYFVTPERFAELRDGGELLEWATVHRELSYGTPRAPVEEALAASEDIILEIDYQGALQVREQLGELAVLVFVAPPTWQALVDRLRGRNTESDEAVAKRLESAHAELRHMGMYHYLIVNETVAQAAQELEQILEAECSCTTRCDWEALQRRLLEEAELSA